MSLTLLGLVWPTSDSISIVGWPRGHMNFCNTLGMYFGGYNLVKHGSRIHFGVDFNGFWGLWEPVEGIFRVGMAYTWQHQVGRETCGSNGPLQCLRIAFRRDNRVKQWSGSLLGLDYNSSWGSQEPIEGGFRVNMACILHHQYGRVAWGSFEHF